jgi:hypothetical protein
MSGFKITAKGKDFQHAVKLIKKSGGVYSDSTKTWTVPSEKVGYIRSYTEYFTEVKLSESWTCFEANGELKEDC